MCLLVEIYLLTLCAVTVLAQSTTTDQMHNTAACGGCERFETAFEELTNQLAELQNKYDNLTQIINTYLLQQKQVQEREKNDERELALNASSFVDNSQLLGIISGCNYVFGVSVLNNQLFVLPFYSSRVNIYDANNLTFIRYITIPDSSALNAIVASPRDNCLYINDGSRNVVYRYNLSDNVISSWSLGGWCTGLSLTSTHNVLATLERDTNQIEEYTPNGRLVRVINLESSMKYPRHSVQVSSDQFVVSQFAASRVCKVDTNGSIIKCYGGTSGSGAGELSGPNGLAVDRHGYVFVADRGNNRVVVLSPSLDHVGYIRVPGQSLTEPYALHLDRLNHRIYIAQEPTSPAGHVIVLSV